MNNEHDKQYETRITIVACLIILIERKQDRVRRKKRKIYRKNFQRQENRKKKKKKKIKSDNKSIDCVKWIKSSGSIKSLFQ